MATIKFMRTPGGDAADEPTIEYSFNGAWMTWPELTDHFSAFLRACGYVLPGDSVAEHIEAKDL